LVYNGRNRFVNELNSIVNGHQNANHYINLF
jgi:hypothetical protein